MTTPATADKKPRRRWFSPRFSLKMLMLGVTVAAIGSAVWWRWPVTQVTEKKQGSSVTREIFTYHRGLRGNLIKHGVHRITRDGKVELEEFYREGLLHGPQHRNTAMGSFTGEWFLGEKDGTWKYEPADYLPPEQRRRAEERWNRGKREVIKRWDHTEKLLYGLEFRNGRLIGAENCLSASLLVQRIAEGTLDDQKPVGKSRWRGSKGGTITDVLFMDVDLEYAETPLGEVIEDLQERFNIPLASRWKPRTIALKQRPEPGKKPSPKVEEMPSVVKDIRHAPVTANEKQEMLLVGFDIILKRLDLALDYRHGVLCVVDAEGATDWKDTTGVMDLHPAADTLLSKQLDAPAKVTYLEPLRDVLRNLAATQEISVKTGSAGDVDAVLAGIPEQEMVWLFSGAVMARSDPSSKPKPLPVTRDPFEPPSAAADPFQGPPSVAASTEPKQPLPLTLRQLLGLLLDQANLHCHEENGVLIIEPRPNEVATQANKAKP
jgi:hypothetical protein